MRLAAEVVRRIERRHHAERERPVRHVAAPAQHRPEEPADRIPRPARPQRSAQPLARRREPGSRRAAVGEPLRRPVASAAGEEARAVAASRGARERSLRTSGAPQAAASTAGSPKPSACDGSTTRSPRRIQTRERLVGHEAGEHARAHRARARDLSPHSSAAERYVPSSRSPTSTSAAVAEPRWRRVGARATSRDPCAG